MTVVVVVPTNRFYEKLLVEPLEVCPAIGYLIYGVVLLATQNPPVSLSSTVPHPLIVVWAALMVTAGASILIGMMARGFAVEVFGLVLIGTVSICYGSVAPYYAGIAGLIGTCLSVPWGVGALIHARKIRLASRVTEEILRESY